MIKIETMEVQDFFLNGGRAFGILLMQKTDLLTASFPRSGTRLYTQAFQSTSSRQGLPGSRAQGCECLIIPCSETYYLPRHCHP